MSTPAAAADPSMTIVVDEAVVRVHQACSGGAVSTARAPSPRDAGITALAAALPKARVRRTDAWPVR